MSKSKEPSLDQEACMGILEPHFDDIYGCFTAGMAMYQRSPSKVKAEHDDRAAAASMHSHVIAEAQRRFDEKPGVTLLSVRNLMVLNVNDLIVGRWKKVNDGGRSRSNMSSKQARDFDRQLELPGVPAAATRLTLGYEPDPAFSRIERVIVSCPLGPTIVWASQIVIIESEKASWVDITPRRLEGTERVTRYRADKSE
jgi:hypothetical protein